MTWTIAVRVQSEIYNNAHIQVAGQQLTVCGRSSYVGVLRMWAFFVCGRSFSQNQNGKTLAWMIRVWIIPVWQIPTGKIPHKEILNKVIIKERNTKGIKYQSINQDADS